MSFTRHARALLLATCVLSSSLCAANTLTANVADYNAAKVATASGALTVPTGLVTYTADSTAVPSGSVVTLTLPAGFTFTTAPTLSDSGTTVFSLTGGGIGSRSAQFTASTADLAIGQSFSLGGFSLAGATALATLTPVASALPVTVQVAGIDATPLSAGAFASEPGAQAVSVGAIQFIDLTPPVLGTKFGTNPTTDSVTAVLAAYALSPELAVPLSSVPVLNPDGTQNSILPTDTITFTMGGRWPVTSTVFTALDSNCATPIAFGTVTATSLTFPNGPINEEVFICITVDGVSQIPTNPSGYAPFAFQPGTSTDFLGAPTNDEFPGSLLQFGTPLPPTFTAAFAPHTVSAGSTATLTFTLQNPNDCNNSGTGFGNYVSCGPIDFTAAFSNTLPAGLIIATPANVVNTCGGSVSATSGGTSVALSGGTIPGGGSCTVSVNVLVQAVGSHVDTSGAIAYSYTIDAITTNGTGPAATAVLAVGPPNVPAPALSPLMLCLLLFAVLAVALTTHKRQQRR